MENDKLIQFIKTKKKREAEAFLSHYLTYVADLEQEAERLREIANNPEGEMARLKEENRSLRFRANIAEAYGFNSSDRAAAELWIKSHYENHHPDEKYQDYSFIITPTSIDNIYECQCNKCGAKHEV